jgi:hypothetical protein
MKNLLEVCLGGFKALVLPDIGYVERVLGFEPANGSLGSYGHPTSSRGKIGRRRCRKSNRL